MAGPVSSPKFIGREQELVALESLLTRAEASEGSVALLSGESGVGKSRLVAELSVRARSRAMTVLVGECLELAEGELPYAPLIGALRSLLRERSTEQTEELLLSPHGELERLLPELATTTSSHEQARGGEGAQARLFEQLLSVISAAARQTPLLLVIEDLHWADRSTRDFIAFLLRNARQEPLALMLTYRSDELHRRHPVKPFVSELERTGGILRVDLRPFSREELTHQVAAIIGTEPDPTLVARLLERSEGNAFFAEELLAASDSGGGLPESLRDALLLRVEGLPAVAHSLLEIAAVAGRKVDHELLRKVAVLSEEQLNEGLRIAVDSQILVHDSGSMGYAFRHALLREAVYDHLLPGERRARHIGLAQALTKQPELAGGSAAAAAELAHHWYAAHELREALPASIRAGMEAEATRALAEAIVHYDRALDIWDAAGADPGELPLTRAKVLQRAGEAEHFAGDPSRAANLAEKAIELVDERTDPVAAALAHERLGRYIWAAGRDQEALSMYRRAVELMPALPPSEERAFVLAAEGQVLMLCTRSAEAEARCEEAIVIAVGVGAPAVEVHALNTMIPLLSERDAFEEAIATTSKALAMGTELGLVEEIGRTYVNGSDALDQIGRIEESITFAREGIERVRELGADRGFGDFLRGEIAARLLRLARWEEADELLAELLSRAPSGFSEAMCRNHLAQLLAERGELGQATVHYERSRKVLLGAADSQWVGILNQAGATIALWEGRPEDAAASVASCLTAVAGAERPFMTARLYELGVRACADQIEYVPADGDERERQEEIASGLLARLDAVSGANPVRPVVVASRAGAAAELSRISGVDGPALWARAREAWDQLGDAYLAAYACWRGAEATQAAGDRGEAERLAREALAVAIRLGARPLQQHIRAFASRARLELEAAGAPTSGAQALERLDLTARELEVMALLAAGRTNREIAAELVISDKTASVHVSHILAKLGVRNRVEAASLAHTLGFAAADQATAEEA
jgi:DNA-binding CsgD family transcriptional regulator/tetratricopeptide (TPR) repeat protein